SWGVVASSSRVLSVALRCSSLSSRWRAMLSAAMFMPVAHACWFAMTHLSALAGNLFPLRLRQNFLAFVDLGEAGFPDFAAMLERAGDGFGDGSYAGVSSVRIWFPTRLLFLFATFT